METVKSTQEHTIYKKRNGRYGVKNSQGKWINGEEKTKILLSEKLIKVSEPKKEEAPAEEAAEAEKSE